MYAQLHAVRHRGCQETHEQQRSHIVKPAADLFCDLVGEESLPSEVVQPVLVLCRQRLVRDLCATTMLITMITATIITHAMMKNHTWV